MKKSCKKKIFPFIFVTLLASSFLGCGKNLDSPIPWPATVASTENFSTIEQSKLRQALLDLNTTSRMQFISFPESSHVVGTASSSSNISSAYPIYFRLHGGWPDNPNRVGYTTKMENYCLIELAQTVFLDRMKEYLNPVIWHELGHCANLNHEDSSAEVMYRDSHPLSYFSPQALFRFFQKLARSGE